MNKKLFTVFVMQLGVFCGLISGQTTIQIGSGTSTLATYSPVSRSSASSAATNSRGCLLYTQAELAALGMPVGAIITTIQFQYANIGTFITPATFSLYMANSSKTSLITGTAWADLVAYHTQVFATNSFNVSGISNNWEQISIIPFTYTGGALEVATDAIMYGASTAPVTWRGTSGASPFAIGAVVAGGIPPALLDGTSSTSKTRPNTRITFTVPPAQLATQTITFNPLSSVTYGTADFSLGATASSNLPVSYNSSNTAVATIVNNQIHITGAGTTTITASQAGNSFYKPATDVPQILTVNKAALQITANNQSKLAGLANPPLTLTYTGFVYGETEAILSTPPTVSTTATTSSPPGTYPITVSGAAAANYDISYADGTLTVAAQGQTITFAHITKTFGDADFIPGATASSGLEVSYASNNTAVATIVNGQIHITGGGTATITASQAGTVQYSAAPDVSKTLTVNKANQSITFSDITKTYGNADFSPATVSSGLPVTYSSSDAAVATIVSGAVHITGAGTATITAAQPGNTNYNAATSVGRTLTVSRTPLMIKANDQTVVQGYFFPSFTVAYTGFVNGDTDSKLQTKPVVSTTIGSSLVPVGTYPLQPAGAVSNNYTITYQGGTLTITAVPVNGAQLSAFFTSPTSCQVRIYVGTAQKAALQVVDPTGRNLMAKELNLAQGVNTLALPVGNLAAGAYIIKVKGENMSVFANVIKPNN